MDIALAKSAVGIAVERHAGRLKTEYSAVGEIYIQYGKNLLEVQGGGSRNKGRGVSLKMEEALVKFICNTRYEDLPRDTVHTVKLQLIALYGATIAGTNSDGCKEIADYIRGIGGKEEASVLMHGGKVPAQAAAFANSVMGRALDICDHIGPGVHIGSAVIPAALATAELTGGCSGKELITAIAVGTEVSLRLNLEEADYDGFDPTGVCAVYASAAASAKLLKLNEEQTLHAMALAFNRCGGSFQSNIDGALAVRVIEGWTAQAGVECARLAKLGITGPQNFLTGVYSYFYLYAREKKDRSYVIRNLGKKWSLGALNFKKYPSCGLTQGSTELILKMMRENKFTAPDVEKIEVHVPPFTYKLVGKFELGNNPKVNAQFSVGYCVANAVVRDRVALSQFEAEEIKEPEVRSFLAEHVEVINDPGVCREHYSSDIVVRLKTSAVFNGSIDVPPGTPGNPMSDEEHRRRFYDCIEFADLPWMFKQKYNLLLLTLETIEELKDIQELVLLLLPEKNNQRI